MPAGLDRRKLGLVHAYIHAYTHTYIHAHACMHTYMHTPAGLVRRELGLNKHTDTPFANPNPNRNRNPSPDPGQPRFGYEWIELRPEITTLPAGLQIELPLDGRLRRARIPPSWTLRVWLNNELGFWRQPVTRSTRIAELRLSAAAFARVDGESVRLAFGASSVSAVLDDDLSAEDVDLFGRQKEVSVFLS